MILYLRPKRAGGAAFKSPGAGGGVAQCVNCFQRLMPYCTVRDRFQFEQRDTHGRQMK